MLHLQKKKKERKTYSQREINENSHGVSSCCHFLGILLLGRSAIF